MSPSPEVFTKRLDLIIVNGARGGRTAEVTCAGPDPQPPRRQPGRGKYLLASQSLEGVIVRPHLPASAVSGFKLVW